MSYILDALKRAEQERHIGQLPNAAITPVHEEFDDEPRRWPWILLAILLIAAIAAGLGIGVSRMQQASQNSPADLAEPAAQPPMVSTAPSTIQPTSNYQYRDSDMPSRVVAVTTTPQVLEQPTPAEAAEGSKSVEFANAEPLSEPPEITAIELLAKAKPAPAPKPPAKAATSNNTATAPTSPAKDSNDSLPMLNEMDYAFRSSIPKLELQFHRHSEDSSRSFVLIDGVRYRQGQILSAGPTLERIIDNGLVLRWQGERFIYPIGG